MGGARHRRSRTRSARTDEALEIVRRLWHDWRASDPSRSAISMPPASRLPSRPGGAGRLTEGSAAPPTPRAGTLIGRGMAGGGIGRRGRFGKLAAAEAGRIDRMTTLRCELRRSSLAAQLTRTCQQPWQPSSSAPAAIRRATSPSAIRTPSSMGCGVWGGPVSPIRAATFGRQQRGGDGANPPCDRRGAAVVASRWPQAKMVAAQ